MARRFPVRAVLIAFALVALPARGDGPLLHEYFEPSPAEDLALSATTRSGDMPAAIETESGVVSAPDATRTPTTTEVPYGGSSTAESADASYQIDRDTTRPDVVDYDDPFIPAVTPFKRLYAHDRVDASLELVVGDKRLVQVPIGSDPVRAGDDQFYGDILVDLVPDTPVRIPTVGPDARLLAAHTYPSTEFSIWKDGADNWFIKGRDKLRVRLIVQLAISRAVFGSEFPEGASWRMLEKDVPPLPESIRPAAEQVIAELGISRSSPREALLGLVAHFRSFAPSGDRPRSSGAALYKELAISKKGVCRHRAYAFVITAHALGLPARMIRNEAHAWVEVFDGRIWHRIDLGGAAGDLESQQDPSLPQHQPPSDPFAWPQGTENTESGSALASRSLDGNADPLSSANDPTAAPSGSVLAPAPLGPAALDAGASAQNDSRPASELSVRVEGSDVRRGEPVRVSGRVTADGEGCGRVRVDFGLAGADGRVTPIQAMSTDAEGRYAGAIVVPLHIDVGDYRVVVSTPGGGRCGKGSAE